MKISICTPSETVSEAVCEAAPLTSRSHREITPGQGFVKACNSRLKNPMHRFSKLLDQPEERIFQGWTWTHSPSLRKLTCIIRSPCLQWGIRTASQITGSCSMWMTTTILQKWTSSKRWRRKWKQSKRARALTWAGTRNSFKLLHCLTNHSPRCFPKEFTTKDKDKACYQQIISKHRNKRK